MSGRIYRLRKQRNAVNFFTFEEYNAVCRNIKNVNVRPTEPKTMFVQASSASLRDNVASFVDEVLQYNGIYPKSKNQYATQKTAFHFNSAADAQAALSIVEKMGRPDSIIKSQIKTDGTVVSTNGVKLKVNLIVDPETGSVTAQEGGGFLEISGTSKNTVDTSSDNSMTKWIIIGGIALVAVVALLVILRKKKVI